MFKRYLVVIAAIALWVSPSSAQYIGIFLDANATSCAANVGSEPWIDLHVVAILEGSVPEMAGAQFQITGVPSGWTSSNTLWVPDPNVTINIGQPMFPTPTHPNSPGVNVAFHTCQTGRVELGRVVLLGATTPQNVHLRVEGFHLVPTDPNCPFTVSCGPPWSKICVGGGEIVLNGDAPSNCQMAVAVRTWTGMKSLYR